MSNLPLETERSLVEEICKPLSITRTIFSYGMTVLAILLSSLALLPLFHILFAILSQGISKLNWETLTSTPRPIGMEGMPNGFANAIVGTIIIVGIAFLISIPFGLMTGIFLSEFGRESKIASTIRFITTVLTGIPSVIVGVFAYGVVVLTKISIQNGQIFFGQPTTGDPIGWKIPEFMGAIANFFHYDINSLALEVGGFSAVAGGFALSILMLPVVALTTEESLKLVPISQRLASAALGGNHFQTTFRIVLRAALPGVTTGILLAVARAAGETAPLIFTALFSDNFPTGLFNPTPSLSVLIYNYANSPFNEQIELAWTASIVLVSMILLLSIGSRSLTRRKSR